MKFLNGACPFAAIVTLTGVVAATGSDAKDLVLTRPAVSGVDDIIAYERAFDRTCRARGASVTFTRQPAHGKISILQGVSIIPTSTPRFGSTGKCAGQSIVGHEIHYMSDSGYHGVDHVSWTVIYDNGAEGGATDVNIVVR